LNVSFTSPLEADAKAKLSAGTANTLTPAPVSEAVTLERLSSSLLNKKNFFM